MREENRKNTMAEELSADELEKVSGGFVTFVPFFSYIEEHQISLDSMIQDGVLTPAEITQMRADTNFRLDFVNKLCAYLHCQPSDIMQFIPESN